MSFDTNKQQQTLDGHVNLPEEHENSGWHQEDLIAGDELQDVLLVGCKFVQEVSDEHQTAGAHRLQRKIKTK